MLLWLPREALPNQKTGAALMKGLLFYDPYALARNDMLIRCIRWANSVSLPERYPEIWKHTVPFFNKVVDTSWTVMKSQGISQNTWFASIKPFRGALLDITSWEQCLNADKGRNQVRGALLRVSQNVLGQRVFAQALRVIAAGSITDIFERSLASLFVTKEKLTPAIPDKHKEDLEAQLKEHGQSLHIATKPRNIDLVYRGLRFPAQVGSFSEEYDLRISAFIKGRRLQHAECPRVVLRGGLGLRRRAEVRARDRRCLVRGGHLGEERVEELCGGAGCGDGH